MADPLAGGPRVVLVDDDQANRALLREVLESEGIRVVAEAGSGAEGAEVVARQAQPCVVLMDLRMPDVGGFEATRMIRQDAPASQVVILTAYDEPLPRKSAIEVGAYAYLVKGCAPQLMRDVILKAWEMAAAQLRQTSNG